MSKDRLVTPSYCLILAANFLLYFGFWLLIPVLPFYLNEVFRVAEATIGIVLSCIIVQRQYRDRKISEDKFTPLFFYCVIGITLGARLGHCIFYDWSYYQNHLIEMILPIRQFPGEGWKWIGYKGLASHGGTLGLIIALWLYCRKTKMHYMDVLDMIAVATPICACCIRLANPVSYTHLTLPTNSRV